MASRIRSPCERSLNHRKGTSPRWSRMSSPRFQTSLYVPSAVGGPGAGMDGRLRQHRPCGYPEDCEDRQRAAGAGRDHDLDLPRTVENSWPIQIAETAQADQGETATQAAPR